MVFLLELIIGCCCLFVVLLLVIFIIRTHTKSDYTFVQGKGYNKTLFALYTLMIVFLGTGIFFMIRANREESSTSVTSGLYKIDLVLDYTGESEFNDVGAGVAIVNNFQDATYNISNVGETTISRRRATAQTYSIRIYTATEPTFFLNDLERWPCNSFFKDEADNKNCTFSNTTEQTQLIERPIFPSSKHAFVKVPYKKYAQSDTSKCKIMDDQTVHCAVLNDGALFSPIGLNDAIAITAGTKHFCALQRRSRQVFCWGSNEFGQLGTGNRRDQTLPTQVVNLNNIVELTAGSDHTCAVQNNMRLFCWGHNHKGQLGINSTDDKPSPEKVEGFLSDSTIAPFSFLRHVEAGGNTTCVLQSKKKGSIACTGDNQYGQLGLNITDDFQMLLEKIEHTNRDNLLRPDNARGFALTTTGGICAMTWEEDPKATLFCWGKYKPFDAGINNNPESSLPVSQEIDSVKRMTTIFRKGETMCVSYVDQTEKCW